jgi:hypothetical protein
VTPDPSYNHIYNKGSGFDWLETDVDGSMITTESVNEMVSCLSAFCKGIPNQYDRENCKFYQYATIFVSKGWTPEIVRPMEEYWKEHGDYPGKPAPKSVAYRMDDMLTGAVGGMGSAEKEWNKVVAWVDRKLTFSEITSPTTRAAFRAVGEQTLRSINGAGGSRNLIKKRFIEEFNKAVEN